MRGKFNVRSLRELKSAGEKVVCLTAYDYYGALICEEAGVDVVLVGDSLGWVIQGQNSALGVTLDAVAHHVRAVRAGTTNAFLVADLPFGSYQSSDTQAVDSAVELMRAGAEAVKLEGDYTDRIKAIVRAGIPVIGHLGYTPQSEHKFGGARIQGKGEDGSEILDQAKRIEEAGVCAIVLELIPSDLAAEITKSAEVTTIGIGAGPSCDGEIQVWHDILGFDKKVHRHTKLYFNARTAFADAVSQYASEVRDRQFPKTADLPNISLGK